MKTSGKRNGNGNGGSYTEVVIRMDERLKGIVETLKEALEQNEVIKREFSAGLKELTLHVNFSDDSLAARVGALEKASDEEKAEKKGALFVYKVAVALMGTTLTILGILKALGLF